MSRRAYAYVSHQLAPGVGQARLSEVVDVDDGLSEGPGCFLRNVVLHRPERRASRSPCRGSQTAGLCFRRADHTELGGADRQGRSARRAQEAAPIVVDVSGR